VAEFQEVSTIATLEPKKEELSTQKILETLNPKEAKSLEDLSYKIYTFKNKENKPVEVLFYSPNELPFIQEEFKDKNITLLGDEPTWRSKDDWSKFKNKIEENNRTENRQNQMIIIEGRPKSLLEIAQRLGIDLDNELKDTLVNLEYKKITPKTNEMIDKIIAGNSINDRNEVKSSNQHEGEALFLLSLQGNNKANEILEKKLSAINKMDQEKHEKEIEVIKSFHGNEEQIESLDSLVLVHCDDYPPIQSETGLEKISTFDATNWKMPRQTFHFYLNGLVESHSYGRWYKDRYVLISPLRETIKLNGKPKILNTNDTFWEVNPGESLKFPENAVTINPARLLEGQLIDGLDSNDIKYKFSDFTREDISEISWMVKEQYGEEKLKEFNDSLIEKGFNEKVFDFRPKYAKDEDEGFLYFNNRDEYLLFYNNLLKLKEGNKLLEILKDKSIAESIKDILKQSNIEASEKNINIFFKPLEITIMNMIKKIAVDKKLEKMGYKDIPMRDQWGTDGLKKLCKELEVNLSAHWFTESKDIEDKALDILSYFQKGGLRKVKEEKRKMIKEKFSNCSPELRRMLYLSGLI
jgi:hypothetical protein